MKIGSLIKKIRTIRGLTQVQLAENMGITQNYLSLIETDKKTPSHAKMKELSKHLQLSEEALIFLSTEPPDELETGYNEFLGEIKTARILQDWISETTEKDITERYNVGMGDVHRFVQSAEWLIYAASEIARITGSPGHIPSLHGLRSRLKYGVRADILELVSLRGIGRVRGRMLHNQGLFNLTELYQVPIEELARIPTIGTAIAESIKKQLGVDVKSTSTYIEPIEETDDFDSVQTLLEDFNSE